MFPDCRTDDAYNEDFLTNTDKQFVRGMDWCTEMAIDNFFDNNFNGEPPIEEDGELTRIEDNWDVFDPTKCKWFPHDFIEIYYDGYSGESPNYNHGAGHEWTDEDAWDAMTDGMYGDYPGSGWDPEMFGY